MATTNTDDVLVMVGDGIEPSVISREAVTLAKELRDRGQTLTRTGDKLSVSPGVDQDPRVRRYRDDLLAMVDSLAGYHPESTQ